MRELRSVAHREISVGGSWDLGRSNLGSSTEPLYIYETSYIRAIHFDSPHTRSLRRCFLHYRSFVRRAVDQERTVSPNLRRQSEDLHGCQNRGLGSHTHRPIPRLSL
jgi:hypothetical protein